MKLLESQKQKIQCSTSYQRFFTPGILPCCRRMAFLISRPSALTRRIVIKWKLCSNDENSHPFIRDLHIVFYLPCQGMKIIFRYPNYVIHTLPRGGGTAFPISLCLSRIVPANSKSSLKVIQVVKCKKLVSVMQNFKTVLLSP